MGNRADARRVASPDFACRDRGCKGGARCGAPRNARQFDSDPHTLFLAFAPDWVRFSDLAASPIVEEMGTASRRKERVGDGSSRPAGRARRLADRAPDVISTPRAGSSAIFSLTRRPAEDSTVSLKGRCRRRKNRLSSGERYAMRTR